MSERPLTWMADAFRKNGLRVREVRGWKTRGRPYSFSPRGVVFHHTASNKNSGPSPALAICVNGRADLPGPLCNVMIGRDATVYVIAAGRANHAGFGGPWRNVPKDSGNSYTAGVEVENNGVGEPWSDEQLRACDLVFATLLVGLRHSESWLCGHKEWAAHRKIDPGHIDMDRYRRRVRATIKAMATSEKKKGAPKREAVRDKAEGDVYIVEAGDTLWSISRQYDLKVDELKGLNGLESDLIHPGDRLKVSAAYESEEATGPPG